MIERKVSKDAWRVNIPAEFMIQAGLEKGGPVCIDYDEKTKKITLWKKEEPKNKIQNQTNYEQLKSIINLNRDILNKPEEKIELNITKAKGDTNNKLKRCSQCGQYLSSGPHLKINGKEICEDCKAREVNIFKAYVQSNKIDFSLDV